MRKPLLNCNLLFSKVNQQSMDCIEGRLHCCQRQASVADLGSNVKKAVLMRQASLHIEEMAEPLSVRPAISFELVLPLHAFILSNKIQAVI